MTCSCAGVISLVVLVAAFVINTVSVSLPVWSTSTVVRDESNENGIHKADFVAGLWGYCTDAEVNTNQDSKANFDHCFLFHSASEYKGPDMPGDRFITTFSNYSACEVYEKSNGTLNLSVVTLANLAGLDPSHFDKFLGKSCGSLGEAALVFGILAPVLGFVAVVITSLGMGLCKQKSWFISLGKWMTVTAALLTTLTFCLWLAQSSPLNKNDEIHLGVSFYLSIVTAVLYTIAAVLIARHSIS